MLGSTCSPTPTRPPTRCRCRTARCRCGRAATGSASATSPRPGQGWPSTATRTRRGRCSIRAGQYLEITTTIGVDHVTLLQPAGLGDVRRLGTVIRGRQRRRTAGGRARRTLARHRAAHRLPGDQRADDDPRHARPDRRARHGHGIPLDSVGIAELDAGIGQIPEWIVVPSDLTTAMRDGGIVRPVTYVLTRERVRPTNRWRSDPEWRIARRLDVPFTTEVDVAATVRIDRRASDAVLAELLGISGPTATARLTGVPAAGGWAAADGDDDTAWITPFGEVVGGALHAELVDPDAALTLRQPSGDYSVVTAVRLTQGSQTVDMLVGAARRRRCVIDRGSRRFRRRTADDRDHRDRRANDARPPVRGHGGHAGSDQRGRQHRLQLGAVGRSTRGAATTSSPSTTWQCPSGWPARWPRRSKVRSSTRRRASTRCTWDPARLP